MKIDHRELVDEVRFLTSSEGFLHTCLDLKDSMLFFDRDLLLAAYGATLELVTTSALLAASLESENAVTESEGQLRGLIRGLPQRLRSTHFPLDAQYLAEQYIASIAPVVISRFWVYTQMFACYRENKYLEAPSVDRLICQAQRSYGREDQHKAVEIMGVVGAKLIRGAHLRPLWLRIGHSQIQQWLAGLQTLINNLRVASQFSFPLEDIKTERLKRQKEQEKVVFDLGGERNLRRGLGGHTDKRITINPDECDRIIEQLLEGQPVSKLAAHAKTKGLTEQLLPILEGICKTRLADVEVSHLIVSKSLELQAHLNSPNLPFILVKLLEQVEPWDQLFNTCLQQLKEADERALPAISQFIASSKPSPLFVLLADLLTDGERTKEKLDLLIRIFNRCPWQSGRELICPIIAKYGGMQAYRFLQAALESLSDNDREYESTIKQALEKIQ